MLSYTQSVLFIDLFNLNFNEEYWIVLKGGNSERRGK